MKGIILAGGTGSRLGVLTKVTNKHLLPVYDKPMIFYPLQTMIASGIKDIIIVSGKGHAGQFLELLGSGSEFGVHLSYEVQEKAGGIAHALALCQNFIGHDDMLVLLADNIFEDDFKKDIKEFLGGAKIFLKRVKDPQRYGVVRIHEGQIVNIQEKPKKPLSNLAQSGAYIYDFRVFNIIRTLKPSHRGELEITDVNNKYLEIGQLKYSILKGFWLDAGEIESLSQTSEFIRRRRLKDGSESGWKAPDGQDGRA